MRGSLAGGLAVELLNGANISGCTMSVEPHTSQAAVALQALPPEVLQSDVSYQCLTSIKQFLVNEGLTYQPPSSFAFNPSDDSSLGGPSASSNDIVTYFNTPMSTNMSPVKDLEETIPSSSFLSSTLQNVSLSGSALNLTGVSVDVPSSPLSISDGLLSTLDKEISHNKVSSHLDNLDKASPKETNSVATDGNEEKAKSGPLTRLKLRSVSNNRVKTVVTNKKKTPKKQSLKTISGRGRKRKSPGDGEKSRVKTNPVADNKNDSNLNEKLKSKLPDTSEVFEKCNSEQLEGNDLENNAIASGPKAMLKYDYFSSSIDDFDELPSLDVDPTQVSAFVSQTPSSAKSDPALSQKSSKREKAKKSNNDEAKLPTLISKNQNPVVKKRGRKKKVIDESSINCSATDILSHEQKSFVDVPLNKLSKTTPSAKKRKTPVPIKSPVPLTSKRKTRKKNKCEQISGKAVKSADEDEFDNSVTEQAVSKKGDAESECNKDIFKETEDEPSKKSCIAENSLLKIADTAQPSQLQPHESDLDAEISFEEDLPDLEDSRQLPSEDGFEGFDEVQSPTDALVRLRSDHIETTSAELSPAQNLRPRKKAPVKATRKRKARSVSKNNPSKKKKTKTSINAVPPPDQSNVSPVLEHIEQVSSACEPNTETPTPTSELNLPSETYKDSFFDSHPLPVSETEFIDVKPDVALLNKELELSVNESNTSNSSQETSSTSVNYMPDQRELNSSSSVVPLNEPIFIKSEPEDPPSEEVFFSGYDSTKAASESEDKKPVISPEQLEQLSQIQSTSSARVLESSNSVQSSVARSSSQLQKCGLLPLPEDVESRPCSRLSITSEPPPESMVSENECSTIAKQEMFVDLSKFKKTRCANPHACHRIRCFFYHDLFDFVRPFQNYRPTRCHSVYNKIIRRWKDPRTCIKKDACGFCHNNLEFLFHPQNYKKMICSSLKNRTECFLGQLCAFRHVKGEISRQEIMRQQFLLRNTCLAPLAVTKPSNHNEGAEAPSVEGDCSTTAENASLLENPNRQLSPPPISPVNPNLQVLPPPSTTVINPSIQSLPLPPNTQSNPNLQLPPPPLNTIQNSTLISLPPPSNVINKPNFQTLPPPPNTSYLPNPNTFLPPSNRPIMSIPPPPITSHLHPASSLTDPQLQVPDTSVPPPSIINERPSVSESLESNFQMPPTATNVQQNIGNADSLSKSIKLEPLDENEDGPHTYPDAANSYSKYKDNIVSRDECREITPIELRAGISSEVMQGCLSGIKVIQHLQTLSEFSSNFGVIGNVLPFIHEKASNLLKERKDPLDVFDDSDNVTLLSLIQKKIPNLRTKFSQKTLDKVELSLHFLEEQIEISKSKHDYLGLDINAIARGTKGFNAEEIAKFIRNVLRCEGKPPPTFDQMEAIGMAVAAQHFKLSSTSSFSRPQTARKGDFEWKRDAPLKQNIPLLPVKPYDHNNDLQTSEMPKESHLRGTRVSNKVSEYSSCENDITRPILTVANSSESSSLSKLPVIPTQSSSDAASNEPVIAASNAINENQQSKDASPVIVSNPSHAGDVDLRYINPLQLKTLKFELPSAFGVTDDSSASSTSDHDMRSVQLSKEKENCTTEDPKQYDAPKKPTSLMKAKNSAIEVWESPSFKLRERPKPTESDMSISDEDENPYVSCNKEQDHDIRPTRGSSSYLRKLANESFTSEEEFLYDFDECQSRSHKRDENKLLDLFPSKDVDLRVHPQLHTSHISQSSVNPVAQSLSKSNESLKIPVTRVNIGERGLPHSILKKNSREANAGCPMNYVHSGKNRTPYSSSTSESKNIYSSGSSTKVNSFKVPRLPMCTSSKLDGKKSLDSESSLGPSKTPPSSRLVPPFDFSQPPLFLAKNSFKVGHQANSSMENHDGEKSHDSGSINDYRRPSESTGSSVLAVEKAFEAKEGLSSYKSVNSDVYKSPHSYRSSASPDIASCGLVSNQNSVTNHHIDPNFKYPDSNLTRKMSGIDRVPEIGNQSSASQFNVEQQSTSSSPLYPTISSPIISSTPKTTKPLFSPERNEWKPPQRNIPPPSPWQSLSTKADEFVYSSSPSASKDKDEHTPSTPIHSHFFFHKQQQLSVAKKGIQVNKTKSNRDDENDAFTSNDDSEVSILPGQNFDDPLQIVEDLDSDSDSEDRLEVDYKNSEIDTSNTNRLICEEPGPSTSNAVEEVNREVEDSDEEEGSTSLKIEDMVELLRNFDQLETEEQEVFSNYLRELKEQDPVAIKKLYKHANLDKS